MNDTKQTAPYATFDTFVTVLQEFTDAGIPTVIDKETFADKSRHDKWQLLGTFKFLDLMDNDGNPTEKLRYLVNQSDTRPAVLRRIMELAYASIFEYGLDNLSREVLDGILSDQYAVNGETLKKARSFFTNACKFVGLELPSAITQRVRQRRAKQIPLKTEPTLTFPEESDEEVKTSPKNENMLDELIKQNGRNEASPSFLHTINLKSGGRLTLSAEVDVWKLNKEDRNLVFKLVDDMKEYEDSDTP